MSAALAQLLCGVACGLAVGAQLPLLRIEGRSDLGISLLNASIQKIAVLFQPEQAGIQNPVSRQNVLLLYQIR